MSLCFVEKSQRLKFMFLKLKAFNINTCAKVEKLFIFPQKLKKPKGGPLVKKKIFFLYGKI